MHWSYLIPSMHNVQISSRGSVELTKIKDALLKLLTSPGPFYHAQANGTTAGNYHWLVETNLTGWTRHIWGGKPTLKARHQCSKHIPVLPEKPPD